MLPPLRVSGRLGPGPVPLCPLVALIPDGLVLPTAANLSIWMRYSRPPLLLHRLPVVMVAMVLPRLPPALPPTGVQHPPLTPLSGYLTRGHSSERHPLYPPKAFLSPPPRLRHPRPLLTARCPLAPSTRASSPAADCSIPSPAAAADPARCCRLLDAPRPLLTARCPAR